MKWVFTVLLVASIGIGILFLGYYQGREAYMAGYNTGYMTGYVNAEKEQCGKR
jgi:hypothetical protein